MFLRFRYFKGLAIKRKKGLRRKVRLRVVNHVRAAKRKSKYTAYLRSTVWKAKRRQRLELAGYLCERCQEPITEKTFECHHVRYSKFGHEPMKDLEALCRECHRRHHALTDGYKRRRYA